MDADGISISADALTLNGGAISGADRAQDAVLTHAAADDDPEHKVDGGASFAPQVTSVGFSLTPRSGETYVRGETIQMLVQFDRMAEVSGSPRVALTIGGNTRYATYHSVSTPRPFRLRFVYTVQASDMDADGISIPANAVDLNGGAITLPGEPEVAAVLTHVAVDNDATRKVDGSMAEAPTVTTVAFFGTPLIGTTYTAGETIGAYVQFDREVDATGEPQLALTIGANTRQASFIRVWESNNSYILFSYIVQTSDMDADGINFPADALSLNGGTITLRGNATTDAVLTHVATAADAGRKVDGSSSAPEALSISFSNAPSGGDTYALSEEITADVQFTKALDVSGAPRLALTIGANTRQAGFQSILGSCKCTLRFSYSVQASDMDDDGIEIATDSLSLNGGTIKLAGASSVDAVLSHSAVNADATRKVDGSLTHPTPTAPTGFRWTRMGASGGTVTLVWGPPHDDGNRPILRYEITSDANTWTTVPGGADAREITYTGLVHNKLYVFGLRAVNEAGPGTKTTWETVILRAGAPEAPRNLAAEAISVHDVRLAWERPSHGANIEVIGYRFEVSLNGHDWSYSGFTLDRDYEERTYGLPGLAGDEFRLDDPTPSKRDSIGHDAVRHYRVAAVFVYRPAADDPHVARGRSPFSAPVRASTQGYALTHPLAGFALNDRTHAAPALSVEDGTVLLLADPAGASHSIQAVLEQDAASLGSVTLELSGRVRRTRADNTAPYELFGDGDEPSAGRALPEGNYTLTASAYPHEDGGGVAIQTLSATFTIRGPPAPERLTGLAVVDTQSNEANAVADGDTLLLPASGRYRLRANATLGAEIGSVRLRLDGPAEVGRSLRIDNGAPYTLTPGANGNGALPAGTYRFRAWAWSKQEGYGSLLEGLDVSFTVAVRALDALELVDATADAVLGAVEDGAELTVTQGVDYNFQAVPAADAGVESVRLELRGPGPSDVVSRTENAAPYTLLGDAGGDYAGAELAAGSYTLSATAYPEPDGAGEALQTLSVSFTVVATATAVVEEPLTAAFEDLPEHHAGEPFEFRVVFSAAVDIGEDAFREHALAVGNASVTAASRVADETGAWVVTVAPDSTAAVELRLAPGRACGEEGALCTAAGTRLSAGLLTMVGGPPPAGALAGFVLVDAESGADLGPVADGATVRLEDPAGGSYDVRVETAADAGVGSVRLALAGPGDGDAAARTDDAAPWLLRGATDGTGARAAAGGVLHPDGDGLGRGERRRRRARLAECGVHGGARGADRVRAGGCDGACRCGRARRRCAADGARSGEGLRLPRRGRGGRRDRAGRRRRERDVRADGLGAGQGRGADRERRALLALRRQRRQRTRGRDAGWDVHADRDGLVRGRWRGRGARDAERRVRGGRGGAGDGGGAAHRGVRGSAGKPCRAGDAVHAAGGVQRTDRDRGGGVRRARARCRERHGERGGTDRG